MRVSSVSVGQDRQDIAGAPDLRQLLTLDPVGTTCFTSEVFQTNRNGFLFGGQVLGQAVRAAAMTVEGKTPHALQAAFEQPAAADAMLSYEVDRGHEGHSEAIRHVVARQAGATLLRASVSFNAPAAGFEHRATGDRRRQRPNRCCP